LEEATEETPTDGPITETLTNEKIEETPLLDTVQELEPIQIVEQAPINDKQTKTVPEVQLWWQNSVEDVPIDENLLVEQNPVSEVTLSKEEEAPVIQEEAPVIEECNDIYINEAIVKESSKTDDFDLDDDYEFVVKSQVPDHCEISDLEIANGGIKQCTTTELIDNDLLENTTYRSVIEDELTSMISKIVHDVILRTINREPDQIEVDEVTKRLLGPDIQKISQPLTNSEDFLDYHIVPEKATTEAAIKKDEQKFQSEVESFSIKDNLSASLKKAESDMKEDADTDLTLNTSMNTTMDKSTVAKHKNQRIKTGESIIDCFSCTIL
jgi:hypothetical protein